MTKNSDPHSRINPAHSKSPPPAKPEPISKPSHRYRNDRLNPSLEENLLTVLVWSQEAGEEVTNLIDPTDFTGDYRLIATRVIAYRQKYKKPPGPHLADLLADIVDDPNHLRKLTYERIIRSMIDLADRMNTDFILDQLRTFSRVQRLKKTFLETADDLNAGQEQAIDKVEARWRKALDNPAPSGTMLVPLTKFKQRRIEWYWEPFFPQGMVSLVAGEKGVYKTSLGVDIAADLSSNGEATLFLAKEIGGTYVLRELMAAAGGDPDHIVVPGTQDRDGFMPNVPDRLTPEVLAGLETHIKSHNKVGPRIRAIEIDPFNSFIDTTKANSDAGVREVLDRLTAIAERQRLLIIVNHHLVKDRERRLVDRIMGSVGIVNAVRSVNVMLRDRDSPDGRHWLINLIGNYVEPGTPNATGYRTAHVGHSYKLRFEPEAEMVHLDEAQIEVIAKGKPGRPGKQDDALAWLQKQLASGPVLVADLKRQAEDDGFGWRTIERAKEETGVKPFQKDRAWHWQVPGK